MKFMYVGKDGGAESTVWGFWPIEIKRLFSIALLCFENGSREAYHSHAFNSLSWVLRGELHEHVLDVKPLFNHWRYGPSLVPIYTSRGRFHKVSSYGRSWVLTFRGPWHDYWWEFLPEGRRIRKLTHGRREVGKFSAKDLHDTYMRCP